MENLQSILTNALKLASTCEPMSERDYEQARVDIANGITGQLDELDGYDCELCRNRGYLVVLRELPNGHFTQASQECRCMEIRRTLRRMQRSGLKNLLDTCTFDRYKAESDWQKLLKSKAVEYADNPSGWFGLFGQSGIGKSHLCTAICRKFLLEGRKVAYMAWREDISRLKDYDCASEPRLKLLERFKRTEVLYIDDLFKSGIRPDGEKQRPTSADINLAFEIVNHRYNNPALLTIVSSEWTIDGLLSIDEATGSRIFERAGNNGINIRPDSSKNYRTRQIVTI